MLTPQDIVKLSNVSGYKQVGLVRGPSRTSRQYYQAYTAGGRRGDWKGPARDTAVESAQDYCDYVNAGGATPATRPTLKSAGHDTTPRAPLPRDPEVEAALGVLRDARAQRKGKQGYVYLIIEDHQGGALIYGKIGYSTNPARRVAELQTGNPTPLRLLLSKPGTEDDEAALHQKYIKDNVLQEWFRITKELLLEWDASHQVPAAQSGGTSHKEATAA